MTYTTQYGLGPGSTPNPIKQLIWITCIVSIFAAFLNNIFLNFLNSNGPQQILSLSWWGLGQWYIWQPVSYFFIQTSGAFGVSLIFFFELLFNMYILWIMGSVLVERVGSSPFLRFYFICGIAIGLITLFLMPVLGQYTSLAGTTPLILGIMTAWTMLHPESELLLFFVLPVKAKWIIVGMIVVTFLINISNLNFINLFFYILGPFICYLYAVSVWGLQSPFSFTHFIDSKLGKLGNRIRSLFTKKEGSQMEVNTKDKIIDFHTGQTVMDDDRFMDAMLEKISKHGEKSLSWSERNRMKKISEKKSRHRDR